MELAGIAPSGPPRENRPRLRDQPRTKGATVCAGHADDPSCYGVADFDVHGRFLSVGKQPDVLTSHYARGEPGITDINQAYLSAKRLPDDWMGHRNSSRSLKTPGFESRGRGDTPGIGNIGFDCRTSAY